MLTRAGFEIEAESDMLMNPADDHTLNVRDGSLGHATDRMLFRARKPRQVLRGVRGLFNQHPNSPASPHTR